MLNVGVKNNEVKSDGGDLKSQFTKSCNNSISGGKLYQLSIPDFDVLTSVPSC